ncbi:MAG: hypothetical protein BWX88_02681 [Planctomycetes bacterium ADurb.Bin126]|nr:MAG: hypothetical protein BWX88_02681 [Planctomycetes bacterium ADurb.Bin126]HOD79967.1 DUF3486 family protein [Phycisphaerae bacterium]HQL74024.1 DUF3486 family protein [Phycisphaerae bacterium]
MRLGPSKAFKLLAVAAGRQASLAGLAGVDAADDAAVDAACAAVAQDVSACQVRDGLWAEYESRLRDHRTYALDDVNRWLADEHDIRVGRSSVDRDRKRLIAAERVNELACTKIKAAFDLLKDLPASDMFAGGTKLIGQMILSNLINYSAESLEALKPAQIITMMDTFGRLSRDFATTQLTEVRTELARQQQGKFDAEVRKAQAGSRDGRISPAQLSEIRKAVFGEAAA